MKKIIFTVFCLEPLNEWVSFRFPAYIESDFILSIMWRECPSPRENLEFALSNPDYFEVMFK